MDHDYNAGIMPSPGQIWRHKRIPEVYLVRRWNIRPTPTVITVWSIQGGGEMTWPYPAFLDACDYMGRIPEAAA